MKAVAIQSTGARCAIDYIDMPCPRPGPHELLVAVKAAGVNRDDCSCPHRPYHQSVPAEQAAFIPGREACGTVSGKGAEVRGFALGDDVVTFTDLIHGRSGSHAELTVVPASYAARKPARLSYDEAAALPVDGAMAYRALFTVGRIREGETVLIHGCSYSQGHIACQLAACVRARTIAVRTAHQQKPEMSTRPERLTIGSEEYVVFLRSAPRIDLLVDFVGDSHAYELMGKVRTGGRIVSTRLPYNDTVSTIVHERQIEYSRLVGVYPDGELLDRVARLACGGMLQPAVASVMPLREANRAYMQARQHLDGKIVLSNEVTD
ncbi:MAG: zinc-binding dehydrogenase [Chitinivibrionales bacterium]|nr:zinc-binding dehydrogenase [Chitinivibrionales bacterium]